MRYDLDKWSYGITSRSHWNLQGLATWGSYSQKLLTVQIGEWSQPDTIGETLHFTIQKWLGNFSQKRFKSMVNQLANDWKKWSFDQPVMDRNMSNSDWMGSWPTAGNSRWVLLRFFMSFFLICKKLKCNFQEKCFFRARTVVCAHASFLVAFCLSLQLQMD